MRGCENGGTATVVKCDFRWTRDHNRAVSGERAGCFNMSAVVVKSRRAAARLQAGEGDAPCSCSLRGVRRVLRFFYPTPAAPTWGARHSRGALAEVDGRACKENISCWKGGDTVFFRLLYVVVYYLSDLRSSTCGIWHGWSHSRPGVINPRRQVRLFCPTRNCARPRSFCEKQGSILLTVFQIIPAVIQRLWMEFRGNLIWHFDS